jgi:hypothetical protein
VNVEMSCIDALKRIVSLVVGNMSRRVERNRGAGAPVRATSSVAGNFLSITLPLEPQRHFEADEPFLHCVLTTELTHTRLLHYAHALKPKFTMRDLPPTLVFSRRCQCLRLWWSSTSEDSE